MDINNNTINNEHELKEDIVIDIYYPNHEPRVASELFERSRHHIIDELKTPCWICGLDYETALKQNNGLELHHFYVEWADSEAIDWSETGRIRLLHKDFDWTKFTKPEDFVDSEFNMMVLCMNHHRGKDRGIHLLPYPIWQVQAVQRKDFTFEDKYKLTKP